MGEWFVKVGIFVFGNLQPALSAPAAHLLTWYVEECGPEIVGTMPLLVDLQNGIVSSNPINEFIRSPLYFPKGDAAYCEQVTVVLGRKI